MRLMVIETKVDELVPEMYKDTIMQSSKSITHWETIEVTDTAYEDYERLRIELEDLVQEMKEKGRY